MPPGEGGGVCAAARPELLGRWSSKRSGRVRRGLLGAGVETLEEDGEWVRFTLFAGGEWRPSAVEGGERAGRGPPGSWMPSDGSDSDLRRVL